MRDAALTIEQRRSSFAVQGQVFGEAAPRSLQYKLQPGLGPVEDHLMPSMMGSAWCTQVMLKHGVEWMIRSKQLGPA